MEYERIEKSLETVKEFSEYVRKSQRAYGPSTMALGLVMLAGFVLMQSLLYKVAWYWIVFLGIIGTFVIAFSVMGFISQRIEQKIGKAKTWVNVSISRIWPIVILGGVCLTIVVQIALIGYSEISEVKVMCCILLGWFVVDGIGISASGVLSRSKVETIDGIALIILAIPIALFVLEYAFLAFGLIAGGGMAIAGFLDYRAWQKEK
jgi:hypothetical protein